MVLRSTPPRLLSGKGRRMKFKERYNLVYIDWPVGGGRMLPVRKLGGEAGVLEGVGGGG